MAKCPACDVGITAADGVQPGELIHCSECESELEVLSVEPFELVLAPKIEEDWGE